MRLFNTFFSLSEEEKTCITIGFFDGVHRGHQKIILKLLELSRRYQLKSVVITFYDHLINELNTSTEIPLITTYSEKLYLLSEYPLDYIYIVPFNNKLINTSAKQFLEEILLKRLKLFCLVIGYDFAFGKDRKGDLAFLNNEAKDKGFMLEIIPPLLIEGEPVSSSAIRKFIQNGDIEKANSFLGRKFSLEGKVVKGEGIGKTLGFPTANLLLDLRKLIPPSGVYKVIVEVLNSMPSPCAGETRLQQSIAGKWKGLLSIGYRPTFRCSTTDVDFCERTSKEPYVEVYILDFNKTIYGRRIKVEVLEKIREQRRFLNTIELIKQIKEDLTVWQV